MDRRTVVGERPPRRKITVAGKGVPQKNFAKSKKGKEGEKKMQNFWREAEGMGTENRIRQDVSNG